jgi:Mrr N-terminal domain
MPRQLPPVDEDIYEYLQNQAVPLEDDINSVLRRLLGLGPSLASKGSNASADESFRIQSTAARAKARGRRRKAASRRRAPKGSILEEWAYQRPILQALQELGGRAPTTEVIERVGQLLDGQLTDADRQTLDSGDVRWRNRAQFVRLGLIKQGDMKPDSPRGVWEISEQGNQRLGTTT